MKTLVTYSSRTGNTRLVAQAVHKAMPEGGLLVPVEDAPDPEGFDFVAVGFWVDKGMPDAKAQAYMQRLSGRIVGVFGTLGAYPDSQHARDCLAKTLELLRGSTVVASFLCQGKVDPKLVEAMSRMPGNAHPMTPERKARLEEAAKHPDATDLANARSVFAQALARLHGN